MADIPHESSSYTVPIAGEDESKQKGHVRHYSDSALADASSWAPPQSPARVFSSNEPLSAQSSRRSEPHPFANEPTKSLQDQVLAGTLGLLKMAGGATLSTTGKLVLPPLQFSQNFLLPTLWAALVGYLDSVASLRVKDYFRILSSSLHHIYIVIGNTAKGKIFRSKVYSVGDGLVDCVSSDVSRQAITDTMAAWVKLSEALHTPETKVLLEQLSVLACRVVDVAASGKNKKLYHYISDLLWTGLELMADPSSTLAFAEVTAYLCFALEMEDAIHHHKRQPMSRQWAAQKRRERDKYQRNAYVHREMMDDPNTTVEQVMMSSLGGEKLESSSLPSNVVLNESSNEAWLSGETDEAQEEMNWRERASDDIDLHFLQQRITKRAASLEQERENQRRRNKPDSLDTSLQSQVDEAKQPTPQASTNEMTNQPDRRLASRGSDIEEMVVTTVDENDDDTEYAEEAPVTEQSQTVATGAGGQKPKSDSLKYQQDKKTAATSLENKEDDEVHEWLSETFAGDEPPVRSIDGESAPNRFYRRLDEIMDKKRTEAVMHVLNQELGADGAQQAGLSWFPKAAAAAGAGNERGQDTIKNRVAAIRNKARSQIGVGKSQVTELADDKDARRPVSFFTICIGLVALFWFAMGFYGCYVVVFGPVGGSLFSVAKSTTTARSSQQEIVVRVVREVVHVDREGKVIEPIERYPPVGIGEENLDQVAACVARAL